MHISVQTYSLRHVLHTVQDCFHESLPRRNCCDILSADSVHKLDMIYQISLELSYWYVFLMLSQPLDLGSRVTNHADAEMISTRSQKPTPKP